MSALAEVMGLLNELPTLHSVDVQIATTLVRRGDEQGERALALALAVALCSRALRDGHGGITLEQIATQSTEMQRDAAHELLRDLPLHDESWWRRHLASSALVGDGRAMTPLVLRDGVLQLHRYFAAEQRIAGRITELLRLPMAAGVRGFSIVTGGPGTGKTTLVATMLVDLVTKVPGMRIALAAPTGKAAARLTESIRARIASVRTGRGESIPQGDGSFENGLLDLEARTLHRLLRYSVGTDGFRACAEDPLEHDLVIVDEASMVDVLMLDALLRALKPGARLMLVGDHNQLASVDAGDVLGVLCRAADAGGPGTALHDSVTRLTYSWRHAAQPGIGALASAILSGQPAATIACLHDATTPDVRIISSEVGDSLLQSVGPHLARCLAASSVSEFLDALDAFRLLSPEREGRSGVSGLNRLVERWMARHGRPVTDSWYHGRPVLVTANDYATRVFNGDVGVAWRTDGRMAVYFRGTDGKIRAIAPGRLPAVETAWAMTVHKSQGSEFDDVVVVLPETESRVMSRELLYTAVTRARRSVTVIGAESAVRTAVERAMVRTSGLRSRLEEAQNTPSRFPGAFAVSSRED